MKLLKPLIIKLLLLTSQAYCQLPLSSLTFTHPALVEAVSTYQNTKITSRQVVTVSFHATDSVTIVQISAVISTIELNQNKPADLLFLADKPVLIFLPQLPLLPSKSRHEQIQQLLGGRLIRYDKEEHWRGMNYDPEVWTYHLKSDRLKLISKSIATLVWGWVY